MRRSYLQYISYVLVVVFTVWITNLAAKMPATYPCGVLLPSQTTIKKPIQMPTQVKIYNTMPVNAKVLGIIHVETHFQQPADQHETDTMNYAKILAGKAGANGIIINGFGYEKPGSVVAGMLRYIFNGQAIYVN